MYSSKLLLKSPFSQNIYKYIIYKTACNIETSVSA